MQDEAITKDAFAFLYDHARRDAAELRLAELDVNWQNPELNNRTFLMELLMGWIKVPKEDNIPIKLIRQHPEIDLNLMTNKGHTALHIALLHQQSQVALFLLDDPRVDTSLRNHNHQDPLQLAISEYAIEAFLASLRPLPPTFFQEYQDRLLALVGMRETDTFKIILRVRKDLRAERNGPPTVFIWILCLQQGYHLLPAVHQHGCKSTRFFQLLLRLPTELQMIICNRLFDLPHSFISADLMARTLRLYIKQGVIKIK